jgi:hypothetical protein
MAIGTPNFKGTAQRNTLVTAIKLPGASTSAYKVLGYRSSDSAISLNPTVETYKDILGNTFTEMRGMAETQPFVSPINQEDYDLYGWALDVWRRRAWNELGGIEAVIITAFEGAAGNYPAIRFKESTVELTDLGGTADENRVNLGITLHFGGETEDGTVNTAKRGENITFTAATTQTV